MHCNTGMATKEHTVGSLSLKEGERVFVDIAYANLNISTA